MVIEWMAQVTVKVNFLGQKPWVPQSNHYLDTSILSTCMGYLLHADTVLGYQKISLSGEKWGNRFFFNL